MKKTLDHTKFENKRQRFEVYELALEAAAGVCSLVCTVPTAFKSQQDQGVRAAARIPLAIAEGRGRRGRDAVHMYRIAYSTSLEASAVLELLVAIKAVDVKRADELIAMLDRVQAMLWRLIQSKK